MMDKHRWENDYQADAYAPNEFGGDNSVLILEATATPAPEKKATTTKKAAAPAKKAAKAPAKKAAAPKKAAPAADDLKKIEGVGPKIEKLFHEAGITTFDALAKAKKKTLTDILAAAGPRFKMHDPTTWAQQAKLAAKGEWDKLAKLQDELKGGKK
ncbi:MAG: glycoside hydrolase family 13 [Lewinellaceae bacterium]|nr:glycoside hydrolase family 13 [Lewinellaceae bacterium]